MLALDDYIENDVVKYDMTFLPARRYRCAGNSHHRVSVCVSLYVTRRYCIKKAELSITQTTPRDSPGTLFF